jgi:hypothetical protein
MRTAVGLPSTSGIELSAHGRRLVRCPHTGNVDPKYWIAWVNSTPVI